MKLIILHQHNGPHCVAKMPDYSHGCQHMPGNSPELSTCFFSHHSWSFIVLYCKQIADCNVLLLNVQSSSGGVHLGIACCQYGSFPQPYSSLEPCWSKVQCFNFAGNYQDCVYSTWLSTIIKLQFGSLKAQL